MTIIKAITTAALIGMGATQAIAGHNSCGPRDVIVIQLAESYGETRQSVGISGNNMVETFANLETGTWTIIFTASGKPSCIVSAGEAFELTDGDLEPIKGEAL